MSNSPHKSTPRGVPLPPGEGGAKRRVRPCMARVSARRPHPALRATFSRREKDSILLPILFFMLFRIAAIAQTPAGTIAGVVRDPSGAAVAGAQVYLVSEVTGLE